MELNELFTNVYVLRVLATVLAGLVLAGFSVLVAEKTIAQPLKRGVSLILQNRKRIEAQVDEATDPLPVRLEKETGIPAAAWSKLLSALVAGTFEGLEAIPLGEPKASEQV